LDHPVDWMELDSTVDETRRAKVVRQFRGSFVFPAARLSLHVAVSFTSDQSATYDHLTLGSDAARIFLAESVPQQTPVTKKLFILIKQKIK